METEQKKIGGFESALKCKCPRCHKGDLFIDSNPYNLAKFSKMHETCSNCDLKYDLEQGFWYGAMYISYAIGVAVAVPVMVLLSYLTELELFERVVVVTILLVLLIPLLFRYSRSLWIHIFVREDKSLV